MSVGRTLLKVDTRILRMCRGRVVFKIKSYISHLGSSMKHISQSKLYVMISPRVLEFDPRVPMVVKV